MRRVDALAHHVRLFPALYRARRCAGVRQLDSHAELVYSFAFSHEGTHIVSGSLDRSVRIWDSNNLPWVCGLT
jgi:WD40 repeat protein